MSPAKPSAGKRSAAARPTAAGRQTSHLVVVGIGGSAGGLHAFSTLLEHLPPDTGMAFVIVSHLDPGHPSRLTQLLASKTQMAVAETTDKVRVAPNRVYVAPPATKITIDAGRLRLSPRTAGEHPHLPIDAFLESLAIAQGERAIGVILSGAASDGARGMTAIKAAGGSRLLKNLRRPSIPACRPEPSPRESWTSSWPPRRSPSNWPPSLLTSAPRLRPRRSERRQHTRQTPSARSSGCCMPVWAWTSPLTSSRPSVDGWPVAWFCITSRTSTPTLATCAHTRQSCRTSTTTSSSW